MRNKNFINKNLLKKKIVHQRSRSPDSKDREKQTHNGIGKNIEIKLLRNQLLNFLVELFNSIPL